MEGTTQEMGAPADSMDAWDAAASLMQEPRQPEDPATDAAKAVDTAADAPASDVPEQNAAAPADVQPEQPGDEPTYSSLDEFLQAQKLDPESFRALPVTVKVDGQERQVPLQDVIKSFQLEGHVNNKSIELSNARQQLEQEQQAFRALAQQQVQQNAHLGQLAMQQLTSEFQRVDWNGLRVNDPAQYAALHADFQQRQAQIQGYLQQVNQQQAQMAQESQAQMAQMVEKERTLMLEKNPEWRDPEKFRAATSQISNYAKQLGFTDAELSQVYDHRYMQVLQDAASYRALQAAKPEALKKVRQAPPTAKAGARQTTDPQSAQRQAVFQRLRQNPRDQDAQAAAFDFFANLG